MATLLAADIGGTKIDFALFDTSASPSGPPKVERLASGDFHSCAEALAACLAKAPHQVDFVVLAVAGPVRAQRVTFTNLPWQADSDQLQQEFGLAGVLLVNDLVALAEGLALLGADDLRPLKPGSQQEGGTRLVVAPGTGLGASFVCGTAAQAQACEAGHLSFSPRSEAEHGLLTYLSRMYGHVSYEMVCSGTGIANIFSYLKATGLPVPPEIEGQPAEQLPPLLAERAQAADIDCPLSRQTYDLFFDVLAEFCGNLAVVLVPSGGIFLGGGMLPRLQALFAEQRFSRRFEDRGKMGDLVASIPLAMITCSHAPLLGAYRLGCRRFADEKKDC